MTTAIKTPSKTTVKGEKGMGMEGPVATWYAKNTLKNIEDFKKDARKIAAEVADDSVILEVAPGPGYLAIELAKLGRYKITGLDISTTFVEIAQANAKAAGVQIDFRHGNAAQMPFADAGFDFIVCRAAFKNFAEPVLAMDEMYRVLRPGGKVSIIDLRGNVSWEAIKKHVNDMNLNWYNTLLTKWAFKYMLIGRAYTTGQFQALAAQSKFQRCETIEDEIGVDVRLQR
jgi:ubiquinone/menaquinone biosynthesis C-methylase UbiE